MLDWREAFLLGNAAILTNACLLPLYPGLIAFLAGSAEVGRARHVTALLGILVLAGVLTTMLIIGFTLALLSFSLGGILTILLPLIYATIIGLGLMMLMGYNPFTKLQTVQAPMLSNTYLTAYIYGLFFGPMTLPCTGPLIIAALSYGVGTGADSLSAAVLYFFFFGLGFGWPLVVLPVLALPFQRRIVAWLSRNHDMLNIAAGVLLIAVGIFGILTELLPQYFPGFYLNQTMQLTYWAIVAVITTVVVYLYNKRTRTN